MEKIAEKDLSFLLDAKRQGTQTEGAFSFLVRPT